MRLIQWINNMRKEVRVAGAKRGKTRVRHLQFYFQLIEKVPRGFLAKCKSMQNP